MCEDRLWERVEVFSTGDNNIVYVLGDGIAMVIWKRGRGMEITILHVGRWIARGIAGA